mgnify:CR=1 FL=1
MGREFNNYPDIVLPQKQGVVLVCRSTPRRFLERLPQPLRECLPADLPHPAGRFFLWLAYRKAFYSPEERKEDIYALPQGEQYENERQRMLSLIREMDEIPYEAVSISAQDGTKLAARYYHVRDGAPLQIQFHGYRGTALRDFCGGNKLARESGQNTLVVDPRAHGKSGGTTITFGIRERWDCLSWVEYVNQRFGSDTPIFLSGVSMGAATVLMAS